MAPQILQLPLFNHMVNRNQSTFLSQVSQRKLIFLHGAPSLGAQSKSDAADEGLISLELLLMTVQETTAPFC